MRVASVFVLAAGLGTRLRPLTSWLPKPLLPVGDRAALAHVLESVRPLAVSVVANAHHLRADVRAFLAASAPDVALSEEERILGTAGGLSRAAELLGRGPVLVWNGDILSSLDAARLAGAHDDAAQRATLATRPLPRGEGNVGIDAGGRIVRLRRQTVREGETSGGAFLGVHVVGSWLRERLPAEGCLVGDVYLPALRQGETLRVYDPGVVDWHDIGTLADYEAACFAWLARNGGQYLGEGAVVEPGVTVERTLVGAGARLVGSGPVDRCIVWPGATVTAPCRASVVTPYGVAPLSG